MAFLPGYRQPPPLAEWRDRSPRHGGGDFSRIRRDYEETDKPRREICAEHRISATTLNNRARQWNWTQRRAPVPAEGPPTTAVRRNGAPAPLTPPAQAARCAAAAALLAASPVVNDPALLVARLRGAMTRVLTAIEIAFAQLLSGPPIRARWNARRARWRRSPARCASSARS